MAVRRIFVPARYRIDSKVNDNRIRQLEAPVTEYEAEVLAEGRDDTLFRIPDGSTLAVTQRRPPATLVADAVLRVRSLEALSSAQAAGDDGAKPRWLDPPIADPSGLGVAAMEAACSDARNSWRGGFEFREEDQEAGTPGLRSPQSGALHAMLAHWKVMTTPATVVMPTGTGKTETMLALLVGQRLGRLLVVVPSVALRDQISRKFVTLGVLKAHGVIGAEALHPVVGTLEHRPRSVAEVDELFLRCNVVVTNMQVAGGCDPAVQERMAELCTHLFIDEAHHISARTWDAFRRRMLGNAIVQFTATPFRTDGRHVDGKVVFNYPLRKAQEEGYFRPIDFRPVNVFGSAPADREIAQAALARLDEDRAAGLRHLVMARVDSIDRAREVHALYRELGPAHDPLLIHSKMPAAERREALRALRADETRVIVCVDMLGDPAPHARRPHAVRAGLLGAPAARGHRAGRPPAGAAWAEDRRHPPHHQGVERAMPRRASGPRLWLRPAEVNKTTGAIERLAQWYVKDDGGVRRPTGCLARDVRGLEGQEREEAVAFNAAEHARAQQALGTYLVEKHAAAPERKRKNRSASEIAVLDVLNLWSEKVVPSLTTAEKTMARVLQLGEYWQGKTLDDITGDSVDDYVAWRKGHARKAAKPDKTGRPARRVTEAGARRELEDLRAAVNWHRKRGYTRDYVEVPLPAKGGPKTDFWERWEAARLLHGMWRARERMTIRKGLARAGEQVLSKKRHQRHLARFLLVGVYTGTRAAAICSASFENVEGRSWLDLDTGLFHRLAKGKRQTNKRQPPVRLPDRLLAHIRRWHEKGISKTYVVEFNGKPVGEVNKGFAVAVAAAGLKGTPHTTRHTCATWLMQRGAKTWDAANFLGMSEKVLTTVYGHWRPDYQAGLAGGRRRARAEAELHDVFSVHYHRDAEARRAHDGMVERLLRLGIPYKGEGPVPKAMLKAAARTAA